MKNRKILHKKKKPHQPFNFPTFKPTSRLPLYKTPDTTALKQFKLRPMAEKNDHCIFDEDQELETQPISLSSDQTENTTFYPPPGNQLPNNVPDSYGAIRQIIASQRGQMSASRILVPQHHPPHQSH